MAVEVFRVKDLGFRRARESEGRARASEERARASEERARASEERARESERGKNKRSRPRVRGGARRLDQSLFDQILHKKKPMNDFDQSLTFDRDKLEESSEKVQG